MVPFEDQLPDGDNPVLRASSEQLIDFDSRRDEQFFTFSNLDDYYESREERK